LNLPNFPESSDWLDAEEADECRRGPSDSSTNWSMPVRLSRDWLSS